MGSKGSKANTYQSQTANQTYTPDPLVYGAGSQALTMAQSAAFQPFQTPAAPVAGFSPDQLAAFQGVRNLQGSGQPYYDVAKGYFGQSAAPVNGDDVNQFYTPMADKVFAQLGNIFGQQQRQTTGQLTQAAGGVGADRIAVGQANLANQQGLAAGQTAAGLYDRALQSALQTKGLQQNAGYGMQGLGTTVQNANLQGAQALLNTGGLQQQLEQQKLMSPYNQQLAQLAYPFQTAQYLAGITGGLAPAMGGTTNQQSQSVTTPPKPSILSQILGGAGLGLAAYNAYADGGGGKGSNFTGMGGNPNMPMAGADAQGNFYGGAATGGRMYADGGMVDDVDVIGANPFNTTGSIVPNIQMRSGSGQRPMLPTMAQPQQQKQDSNPMGDIAKIAKMAMMFINRGGAVRADGGAVNPYDFGRGFAEGGTAEEIIDDRFPLAGEINAGSLMDNPAGYRDQMRNNALWVGPMQNSPWQGGDRFDAAYEPTAGGAPVAAAAPPRGVQNIQEDDALPPEAMPAAGDEPEGISQPRLAATFPQFPASERPYQHAGQDTAGSRLARSPWLALMQASLATMAGTSPYAGINIGKGGMEGIKTLQEQRKADHEEVSANQRAQQLWQQAQQEINKYTRMTPYEKAQVKERQRPYEEMTKFQKEQVAQQKRLYDKQIAQLELEGLKPFKVGVDPDTNLDVYGVRDPNNGALRIVDPKTGAFRDPKGGENTYNMTDPSMMGEDYLKTLSPQRQAILKQIAEGHVAPPTGSALRSPRMQILLEQLSRGYPGFDATIWKSRNETRAAFAKGVEGRAVTSLNTVMSHMNDMRETMEKLSNKNIKVWNRAENAIRDQLGQTALADYRVARTAVADELARVFQGAGAVAEAEKDRWLEALDSASSPEQFRVIMGRLSSLIKGRMNALESQHDRGMNYQGDNPESRVSKGFLDPEAKKKFENIQKWSRETQQETPAGGGTKRPAHVPVGSRHGTKGGKPGWETPDKQWIPD